MYKSMFRPEVELCFFRPCAKLPSLPRTSEIHHVVFPAECSTSVYINLAMSLSLLHFQPCAGSEPDCNCCLSNKYTYMQLRSPEVTRVNFHLTLNALIFVPPIMLQGPGAKYYFVVF